ncbi:MAG TPA: antibiotic biosynthesis monooxygenase [Cellulomonas sp.]|uniref:antibiotic biosynthesis monooxygenase n=1 Tax=Cellulomonas sp. TaxID=40001 RepID=UPI002E2F6E6B|nr:antibiotic biosynthesis monooxygenase [Cellulomonas sp.]HEX5333918.1 antibiotic biosynthesis monooxygenase [Cellulomonas sp.]
MKVMTEVSAIVEPGREADLLDGFRRLLAEPKPDGLERTELLRARDGAWRIQTLWRDQAALDRMRAAPEPPAAPQLFRQVGADPVLAVFRVEASTTDGG